MFVVDPPGSGTTLKVSMLGRHPDIFVLVERAFFDSVYNQVPQSSEWRRGYLALYGAFGPACPRLQNTTA